MKNKFPTQSNVLDTTQQEAEMVCLQNHLSVYHILIAVTSTAMNDLPPVTVEQKSSLQTNKMVTG